MSVTENLPCGSCMAGKQREKAYFLPEDISYVSYLPTEPSRDKAHFASARLLAQASSPGPGGWCGASRFMGRRCPGLPPPHLPPVLGGERAPCHPAQGWADPSTGSRLKQAGSCPSSPGQGTTPIPACCLQQLPTLPRPAGLA